MTPAAWLAWALVLMVGAFVVRFSLWPRVVIWWSKRTLLRIFRDGHRKGQVSDEDLSAIRQALKELDP